MGFVIFGVILIGAVIYILACDSSKVFQLITSIVAAFVSVFALIYGSSYYSQPPRPTAYVLEVGACKSHG